MDKYGFSLKGWYADMNDVVQMITTLGFPIVCCIFLGWYVKYSIDKYTSMIAQLNQEHREDLTKMSENHSKEISELNTLHREETESLKDALNNNTLALQKLCDKLDKESDNDGKRKSDD